MVKYKSPLLEAAEALNAINKSYKEKEERRIAESTAEREKVLNKIYEAEDRAVSARRAYNKYSSDLKNELLEDAIKCIYIGALQENVALTDGGINLANRLVENYVKESGGADAILNRISDKTYALNFISRAVTGTHEYMMEDADCDDPDSLECDEEKKTEMYADMSQDTDIKNAVEVISKRVTDAEEEFIKKNNEDKEALNDIANKFSERIRKVEDDETVSMNNNETGEDTGMDNGEGEDTGTEDTSDTGETDTSGDTTDTDTDNSGEDTGSEDTEETDTSDSREEQTDDDGEDTSYSDEEESEDSDKVKEAKQEASILYHREINNRREKRIRNVFEQVVINLTNSILKDENLREEYIEDGKLNMGAVVESAKCIYGFLETVNTLQLEKVDAKYIQNALSTM